MTNPKRSVDLGYPTPAAGKIPAFNSIEEEAEFWNTHSFTDFKEELTRVDVRVAKNLSDSLSVRLDPKDRDEVARIADSKGIGPSTLIRMWVKEQLKREARAGKKAS